MSIFRKGKLRPLWRYSAKHIVWRVIPTGAGKLVIEERDIEKKHARFICINQRSGRVEWDKAYDEAWWIGVEAVHGGVLLLHTFASPDMPDHRGIVAVLIENGNAIWQNEQLRFEGIGGNALFCSMNAHTGVKHYELELLTGRELRQFESVDALKKGMLHDSTEAEKSTLFPRWAPALDACNSGVQQICRAIGEMGKAVGPVEYLDVNNHMICSHRKHGDDSNAEHELFDTFLHVLCENKVMFSDQLSRNSPSLSEGGFFVEDDVLFYVKERSILTAVRLQER